MKNTHTIKTLSDVSTTSKSPEPAVEPRAWSESSSDWDTPPPATGPPRAPSPIALQAKHLAVRYGSHQALSEITFSLHVGDTVGLLGLNGAGKSTLLRVVAGALAPDEGSVHVSANELYEDQIAARKHIGYAPDKPAVYPEFTVSEYLTFIARMRRIEKRQITAAISNVVELCGLSDVRRRIIGNLSTGFQQRINLAQALIHSPAVLILDEPTNGLDPMQIIEMRELIASLAPHQATIFSSHQLSEVNATCNRVILIHRGAQMLDSSLEYLSHPENVTFDVTLAGDTSLDLKDLPGISEASRISERDWIVTGRSINTDVLKTMLSSRGVEIEKLSAGADYLETLFRKLSLDSSQAQRPSGYVKRLSNPVQRSSKNTDQLGDK